MTSSLNNNNNMESLEGITDLLDNFNLEEMLNSYGARRNSLEEVLSGFSGLQQMHHHHHHHHHPHLPPMPPLAGHLLTSEACSALEMGAVLMGISRYR